MNPREHTIRRKGRREFNTATTSGARPIGRCPDCGHAVEVESRRPHPARVLAHACPARSCEAPGCPTVALREDMVRVEGGAWYCPRHALVLAAKTLVSLYRVNGEADWTAISEILGESLPEILAKLDASELPGRGRTTAPGSPP